MFTSNDLLIFVRIAEQLQLKYRPIIRLVDHWAVISLFIRSIQANKTIHTNVIL